MVQDLIFNEIPGYVALFILASVYIFGRMHFIFSACWWAIYYQVQCGQKETKQRLCNFRAGYAISHSYNLWKFVRMSNLKC